MSDNSFDLELFNKAYNRATTALKNGNNKMAKRYFLQASEIMERIAQNSEPSLKSQRLERADKLKFIARSLDERELVSTAKGDITGDGESKNSFVVPVPPNQKVTFDDIVGLDEAKAAIHRLLIDPLKSPEVYSRYGIKAGGFILLEGPPGTGKTTFAKAVASELSVPFAEINANALIDSYIGKTGKNIDKLFEEARSLAKSNGTPVVLFIDEIDYLAQKRGGENKTAAEAVPSLIKQMDGFSTSSDDVVIIAATNIKETLDTAILSRFSNIITVPLPTGEDRKIILRKKLDIIPNEDLSTIDFEYVSNITDGFSGRDLSSVANELKNTLAARDAGIKKLDCTAGELIVQIINKKK